MPLDHTPQLPSLGDSALLEGKTLGKSEKAGMTIRYEVARCSCQGENENCFKCDGTGYYRREVVEQYRHMDENKLRGQSYFNQRNSNGEYRFSERVHNLLSMSAKNAKCTNCKLVLSHRSQFFHNRLFLSNQAKLRSTTQRLGMTLNVCSSLRLATCTVTCSPKISRTPCAKGSPV